MGHMIAYLQACLMTDEQKRKRLLRSTQDSSSSTEPLLAKNQLANLIALCQDLQSGDLEANTTVETSVLPTVSCSRVAFYGITFVAAFFSALIYWYTAMAAGQRYIASSPDWLDDVSPTFFNVIAPSASVATNLMFNWISFIELYEAEQDESATLIKKLVAIIASAATIAPYFYVGFDGDPTQQGLVVVSAALSLPVFYLGSFDFYKYIYSPLLQKYFSWNSDDRQLAAHKHDVVNRLKNFERIFCYANKETRQDTMAKFNRLTTNQEKVDFLLRDPSVSLSLVDAPLAFVGEWFRAIFSSGLGLIGFIVLAQNIGHVAEILEGMNALAMPLWADIILCVVLSAGNLIPGLGFSFAGMCNFDLLDLFQKIRSSDIPQVQRCLVGSSFWLSAFSWLILTTLRLAYICSGFGNDQVNYEGARYFGGSNSVPLVAGLSSGIAGALVFNGVQCELLFRKIMKSLVLQFGDHEDVGQVNVENGISELVSEIEFMPLTDYRGCLFSTSFENKKDYERVVDETNTDAETPSVSDTCTSI